MTTVFCETYTVIAPVISVPQQTTTTPPKTTADASTQTESPPIPSEALTFEDFLKSRTSRNRTKYCAPDIGAFPPGTSPTRKTITCFLASTSRKQVRLESLMLMSIEDDLLEQLDVNNLVQLFVDMAPRRMDLV